KVGAKIFKTCIKDHLKEKTRIMVTNQLHFLPEVDRIILLDKNEVAAIGTYEELLRDNATFASMLAELQHE
ncbi:ABCC2, partial [Symbiodinium sp. KB8]